MWEEYSIDVNEKGKICFNDIVLNIIKSKNFNAHIKMLDQSKIQYVDKKLYISQFEAIKFICLLYTKNAVYFCNKYLYNNKLKFKNFSLISLLTWF